MSITLRLNELSHASFSVNDLLFIIHHHHPNMVLSRSSPVISFISAAVSSKSRISMFSFIRSMCVDFGMITIPCWYRNLSPTCALLLASLPGMHPPSPCISHGNRPSVHESGADRYDPYPELSVNHLWKTPYPILGISTPLLRTTIFSFHPEQKKQADPDRCRKGYPCPCLQNG